MLIDVYYVKMSADKHQRVLETMVTDLKHIKTQLLNECADNMPATTIDDLLIIITSCLVSINTKLDQLNSHRCNTKYNNDDCVDITIRRGINVDITIIIYNIELISQLINKSDVLDVEKVLHMKMVKGLRDTLSTIKELVTLLSTHVTNNNTQTIK
jgi:hypothetical protein